MSATERDYFNKLFSKLKTMNIVTDYILEIGFGLGISAGLIQQDLTPVCHEIVEIDKGIYSDLLEFAEKNSSVRPLLGDWRSLELKIKNMILYSTTPTTIMVLQDGSTIAQRMIMKLLKAC